MLDGRRHASYLQRFKVSQPFFSVRGRLIAINAENVQVFEYRDQASAQADAARVSADGGTIGNSHVDWVAPPHFYRTDRLLVLYVGNRTHIKTALEGLVGPHSVQGGPLVGASGLRS